MRILNDALISTAQSMTSTTTINSDPLWLGHVAVFAIQAVWTGTPTGTFKLQASVTRADDKNFNQVVPTNWEDIADSSYAVAGAAGSYTWNYDGPGFNWVRMVYTNTSGTGSLTTVTGNAKGF